MSDKDIIVWNSMILGCACDEDFDLAFRIFRGVWHSGLKPNSITLISIFPVCTKLGTVKQGKVVHGYAIRSSLGIVVSVVNSLLDMYCKCRYLDLGAKVFDQMSEKNVVTCNTVISAHGIQGQAQQAFSFFDMMKAADIKPNKVTFLGLLSACSHSGLIDKGWSLYSTVIDDFRLQPDMEHYSCMVDLLCRAGQLGDAFNFIKMMPVEPDLNVLGSLIGSCRAHYKVDLANLVGTIISQRKNHRFRLILRAFSMSGEEEENAAELKIGDEFLKAKCLMNCEVALILERKYEQLQHMADDPMNQVSQVFEKSLQYVKRFSRYKNPDAVRQAREILSRYQLAEFELCVLGNLSPETVEEAIAIVPSMKSRGRTLDEEAIEKMLNDLSMIKKFD
ncbi:hypothetical protein Vadar_001426 [Vaccinium darrowii]|uniref:Uncharacterized protein n=1 Tax=Vaccinium darrowii TaxID=229202 RepID=A0ACB7YSP0_9ERIC|nr:hypothetical protein Vadar_001426 [Vaccinium darrowii]